MLSVLTYKLGNLVTTGHMRDLIHCRHLNYYFSDVIDAFSNNTHAEASSRLEESLKTLLD